MNKLTQEQVSELSDFELNKGIAEYIGELSLDEYTGYNIVQKSNILVAEMNDDPSEDRPCFSDYCNNWNDLMPLVVENNILDNSLFYGELIDGTKYGMDYLLNEDISFHFNSNKLERMLAECLLLALQEKDNNE